MLNELDITCYNYEQQRRRHEEYLAKKKVTLRAPTAAHVSRLQVRDDLVNQMREKSNSQAATRERDDIEFQMHEDRLNDWNDHENMKCQRNQRRKERNRRLLLRQANDYAEAKRAQKQEELDEGRRTAAQIREDIHLEKERMMKER